MMGPRLLGAVSGPVLAVALATAAMGYFTSFGSGAGAASVGTLQSTSPATTSAQPGGAHLAWTIVPSPSGASSDLVYTVERSIDAGTNWSSASNTCVGSLSRTTTACDDVPVVSGVYAYRVISHFRSWTSTATGNSVFVDVTAPSVSSINRAGSSPTNASSVSWTVTFSENVSGVNSSDFALVNGGLGGTPTIATVTGGPGVYTVSASAGTGNGTLSLRLVDNDSIVDGSGNPLGGAGAGNGNFAGQVYAIDGAPYAVDIQAANGGANPGRIASGDVVTYTFSEAIDPNTIRTGWNGSSQSVTVSLVDGGANDTMAATGTNLGSVALGGDYMKNPQSSAANMLMSGSTITLTITSGPPSGQTNTVSSSTMVWSPSTSAKDLAGNSVTSATATEAGAPKKNF